jgi:hypothetical protein
MTRDELIEAYAEWLSRFHWQWFGTLTFRRQDIPQWKANWIFEKWITEIEEENATSDDVHWFRATEYGASGDHLHFHILVGGLKNGSKWPWVIRWIQLAGDCDIHYYRRELGGIRYLLKEAHIDSNYAVDSDFEFELPSRRT